MKLDLNISVIDLDGTNVKENGKDLILSKIVASRLFDNPVGIEPIKAYDLAMKFYYEGEAEVDLTDLNKLKNVIEQCSLSVFIKAPILKAFMAAELAEKSK